MAIDVEKDSPSLHIRDGIKIPHKDTTSYKLLCKPLREMRAEKIYSELKNEDKLGNSCRAHIPKFYFF